MSDARVRVLYFVSTLRRTGPTAQLRNVVRHLDRSRFAPVIVTISPESKSSMMASFADLDVPIHSLALSRIQGVLPRDWRAAVERAAETSFDDGVVVHTQGIRADSISASHFKSVPRVATARNFPSHDYVMKYGPLAGKLMAWAHLRALRALPAVVACSSSVAALLETTGVDAQVIRNGVDSAAFTMADPARRAELRATFGLAPDARVGVCVGELSRRKDPMTVIRALETLRDPALTLLFIGGGALEAECRELARGDARIRFTGHVEDVVPYLQSADFFVSAAHSEGMPNAVLEAIACGLRVLLSDIDPHAELLGLVPFAGELFAVGDAAALAAALARAAAWPALDERDRERATDEIGAGRMSSRYQALYARLASERRRA